MHTRRTCVPPLCLCRGATVVAGSRRVPASTKRGRQVGPVEGCRRGIDVYRLARIWGDDWARENYGSLWDTALVKGVVREWRSKTKYWVSFGRGRADNLYWTEEDMAQALLRRDKDAATWKEQQAAVGGGDKDDTGVHVEVAAGQGIGSGETQGDGEGMVVHLPAEQGQTDGGLVQEQYASEGTDMALGGGTQGQSRKRGQMGAAAPLAGHKQHKGSAQDSPRQVDKLPATAEAAADVRHGHKQHEGSAQASPHQVKGKPAVATPPADVHVPPLAGTPRKEDTGAGQGGGKVPCPASALRFSPRLAALQNRPDPGSALASSACVGKTHTNVRRCTTRTPCYLSALHPRQLLCLLAC